MKSTGIVRNRSRFWPRLLGLIIACGIIALMVAGGVDKVMSEFSALHHALAASQMELHVTQDELASARGELHKAQDTIDSQALTLQRSAQSLRFADAQINRLLEKKARLSNGFRQAVTALAERTEQLKVEERARQAAESALERYQQQPKLSVVMTTERQFEMSQRKRSAAAQTQLFAEGDGGRVYYASASAFHEKEQHLRYSERSQVVLTQTGPGDDVLRCLRDGCAMILAAQQSAMQMESYAYQSQFVSSEMLMVDGRRGRRPGRRR